jgi:hypothetical protein
MSETLPMVAIFGDAETASRVSTQRLMGRKYQLRLHSGLAEGLSRPSGGVVHGGAPRATDGWIAHIGDTRADKRPLGFSRHRGVAGE